MKLFLFGVGAGIGAFAVKTGIDTAAKKVILVAAHKITEKTKKTLARLSEVLERKQQA